MKPSLQGRCAAQPVKAPSSQHMLLSQGYWPYHTACIFHGLWKFPHRNILTHLRYPSCRSPTVYLCLCLRGGEGQSVPHMSFASKYVSGFTSSSGSRRFPCGPLCALEPRGFKAQNRSTLQLLVGFKKATKIKVQKEYLKEKASSHPVFLLSFSEGA